MIGDAFSYLKEYKELEAKNKKYKNYKTKHEFLSKFQKTDRLHPIVTICIYYGEDSLKLEQEGVELNMCKALEELEERGRAKGRILLNYIKFKHKNGVIALSIVLFELLL